MSIEITDNAPSLKSFRHSELTDERHKNSRLDQAAAKLFTEFSRSRLQKWIKTGELTVDGKLRSVDYRLKGGENLVIEAEQTPEGDWLAQDISLDVVYEDHDIIVVNKPKDLVVHPAAGNWKGTLLNGLLFRYPQLRAVPRAGIVHRLDKDTTGLMVVAKTIPACTSLVNQLQSRTVKRVYEAIVRGHPSRAGSIDKPIARHPIIRTKMATVDNGKQAITRYEVLNYYDNFSHVRLKLETGRTHQIRVHMADIKHPIIGDALYGGRSFVKKEYKSLGEEIRFFSRQALHATVLGLSHPASGKEMSWYSKLPKDMVELLRIIKSGT